MQDYLSKPELTQKQTRIKSIYAVPLVESKLEVAVTAARNVLYKLLTAIWRVQYSCGLPPKLMIL